MQCTAIDNTVVAFHALVNMDTNHVKGPIIIKRQKKGAFTKNHPSFPHPQIDLLLTDAP